MENEKKVYTGKDESLMPGYIVYDPLAHNEEKKYRDEERMYQGIPSIERTPNGTLLYTFITVGLFIIMPFASRRGAENRGFSASGSAQTLSQTPIRPSIKP